MHSNGGTGFQPVHAQAEACGYQKLPYDRNLGEDAEKMVYFKGVPDFLPAIRCVTFQEFTF